MNIMLETSPGPLYIKIADTIRGQIMSGIYQPGAKLPKEATLVERFQSSRITIRAALQLLVDEGIVVKQHGLGTFVTGAKKTVSINSLQGFYSILVRSGAEVKTTLQSTLSIKPVKAIVEALKLTDQATVRRIDRLYYVGQNPVAMIITHLHRDVILTDEEAASLTAYGVLTTKMNIEPLHARYLISATKASEYQSKSLSTHKGDSILVLSRVSYDADGLPIEHTSHFIRPEICELEYVLSKDRPLEDLQIVTVE